MSAVWSIPAWQQAYISADSPGSTTMRNVPDVALNADPRECHGMNARNGPLLRRGPALVADLLGRRIESLAGAKQDGHERQKKPNALCHASPPLDWAIREATAEKFDFPVRGQSQ